MADIKLTSDSPVLNIIHDKVWECNSLDIKRWLTQNDPEDDDVADDSADDHDAKHHRPAHISTERHPGNKQKPVPAAARVPMYYHNLVPIIII